MALSDISPQQASDLLKQGALLVDIRETDEYRREHIASAHHQPLSSFPSALHFPDDRTIIFHCRSGMRTKQAEAKLAAALGKHEAFIMQNGINGWKAAGLPVVQNQSQPLDIMRQVQIAAGSLVLAGIFLGFALSPVFYFLSAFVGAGLVFAGISGFCGMAKLLQIMPWNRR